MSNKKTAYQLRMEVDNKEIKKSPASNATSKTSTNYPNANGNVSMVTPTSSFTPKKKTAYEIRMEVDNKKANAFTGNNENKNSSKYNSLLTAGDFRKYSSTGANMDNPSYHEANKGISIAGWKPFAERVQNKVTYSRANAPALAMDTGKKTGDPKYTKMTDTEVNIYNYLLAKDGEDSADKYLKSIDADLNYRYTNAMAEGVKEVSDENKVAGTAMNLALSMLTPAAYIETARQTAENKITGKKEKSDPYSGVFGPVNMEQATREGLKQDTGAVGDFAIDTGLSMAQFLTKLPLGENAALAIMGTGAAGQTSKDVIQRGGTQDQAMLSSTIAGATEILTEKISIDQLKAFKALPAKNAKSIIKNVLKSSFTEGSEEAVSDVVNEIADRVIMGDYSNYDLNVASYIKQGMSEQQAKNQARLDFARQVGLDFAGGAISGGIMGAGANVLGNYSTGRSLNKLGVAQDVINEGLESQASTVSNQAAQKLQQQFSKNQRVSNMALGNLYNANVEAINEEEAVNQQEQATQEQQAINSNVLPGKVLPQEIIPEIQTQQPQQEIAQRNVTPINLQQSANQAIEPIKTEQASSPSPINVNAQIRPLQTQSEPLTKATATFLNSDTPITVKGVNSVSKNNLQVVIDDGNGTSVANLNDISFSNPNTARVYTSAAALGSNGAKAFITGYKENISLDDYTKGFQRYYKLGKTNFPMNQINSAYSAILPSDVLSTAYYAGVNDSKAEIEERQQKANKTKPSNKPGVVKNEVFDNMDDDTKLVLHVLGLNTKTSIVMEDDIEGANGYYKDGEIHISQKADNPALVVFAHELTHHLEDTSPKLWKEYRDYVVNYMESEHSEKYKALVDHTKNLYRENGQEISDDEILNEIAANATEEFLTDTKAIEKLSSENKSLAQEFVEILKGFIEKIKSMMQGYDPKSTEGKLLRQNIEVLDNARKLWLNAIEGATAVSSETKKVASIKEKFSLKDTYTDNFKKWFGDWQNNPSEASKVVNDDGTPKIMYAGHSNTSLFGSVFDINKATAGGLFFTDNPEIASNYATGKIGSKENFMSGEQYRFEDSKGNYTKNIREITLTPEQIKLAEDFTSQDGDMTLNDYINDNRKFDKTVNMWGMTGGNRSLSNFYNYYEYEGKTANSAYKPTQNNPTGYEQNTFEDLLDAIGLKWESFEVPKPGVFPVYISIKNPIDTSKGIPSELMTAFELEASKDKKNYQYDDLMYTRWTKDYPMKKWVEDIKRMYETGEETYWATQIPAKARRIMKDYGYDGIKDVGGKMGGSGHDVWIALDSTQVNSAIGNIGKYSTTKKDIRFSLKDTSDVDIKSLTEENAKLKETNELLNQQFKLTKGYKPGQKALERIAGKIIKETSSTYDRTTLVDNLKSLFDYIGESDTMSWDEVMEVTTGMAKGILEKSSKLNTDLYDRYTELRNDLRTTAISLSDEAKKEVAYHYDSYNNFRTKNYGKIRLTKDGINLDQWWGELSSKYPELFNADTNELEQPLRLADALNAIKPYYANPYGMDMDAAAYDLALELYGDYFNTPGVVTFADKKAEQLKKVKRSYQQKIDDIKKASKEKYDERLKQIKQEEVQKRQKLSEQYKTASEEDKQMYKEMYSNLLSRKNEQLDKQRATFQEKKAESRNTLHERNAIKKYKARITKNATELTKWITHPTDAKHVPEALKRTVTEFLTSIDLTSDRENIHGEPTKATLKWQSAMNKMRSMLDDMEKATTGDGETGSTFQDFYMDIDPKLVSKLNAFILGNEKFENINTMNSEQLKELDFLVGLVKRAITDSNKLKANLNYETVKEAGMESISELNDKREKKLHNPLINKVDKFTGLDQMDSFSFFDSLGKASSSMLAELRKGQDKHTLNLKQAMDYMDELTNGIKTHTWTGDNAEVKTFTIHGNEVKMTVGQVMELYVLNKREQARTHIQGGGIRIEDVTGREKGSLTRTRLRHSKPISQLSDEIIDYIVGSLSEDQKKVADGMQEFMSVQAAEWGNETSLDMYGYKKFTEKNYYPIKSDDNYTITNDQNSTAGQMYAIKNLGMTKELVKNANNPLIIGDIFDTFTRHVNEMSTYNSLMIPLSDAMKWYNFKVKEEGVYLGSVKEGIERVTGKGGKAYFTNLMKDINGVSQAAYSTEIFANMIANAKVASVGANIRVVAQQPTAYLRAAYMIDPKYLAMGLMKRPQIAKANQYTPISLWKSWGFFDTNTGRSMRSIITGEKNVVENIREKSLWLAGELDNITWGTLWNAVEYETKATKKDLVYGSEEFNKAVGERLSEVVDRTQVVDTIFHRSQMMRSKDVLLKTATSFMSEPNKNYNLMRNAILKAIDEKSASAYANLARATIAMSSSGIAAAAAAALVDSIRDKEKDKKWSDTYKESLNNNISDNLNPLNMLPITREIISMMNGFKPSRMDMTALTNVYYSFIELVKWSKGESKKSNYAIFSQTSRALSQAFGIPVGNLLREFESIYNFVSEDGIEMKSDTSSRDRTYETMYNALMEGDTDKYAEMETYLMEHKSEKATEETVYKSIDSGIRKVLLEKEPMIKEAGDARLNGNIARYKEIVTELKSKGFEQDTVVKTVNAYMDSLKPKKEKVSVDKPVPMYSYDDLFIAIDNVDFGSVATVANDLLSNGKDAKAIKTQLSKHYKPIYEEYIANGDTENAAALKELLMSDFDYEEDTFDDWGGLESSDMVQALQEGDFDTVVEIRDKKLSEAKDYDKALSSIRSSVTRKMKPVYISYVNNEEWDNMRALKQNLIDYFGYQEKTIDNWLKDE